MQFLGCAALVEKEVKYVEPVVEVVESLEEAQRKDMEERGMEKEKMEKEKEKEKNGKGKAKGRGRTLKLS